MDSDLEELESRITEHFGRTPVNTPCASQEEDSVQVNHFDEDRDDLDLHTLTLAVENRITDFLDDIGGDETVNDDHSDSEDEYEYGVDEDMTKVNRFKRDGCGCHKQCSMNLDQQKMFEHILSVRELPKEQKDMYIMGSITVGGDECDAKRGKKRKRQRSVYSYAGTDVCKKTFMLVFDVGRFALESLIKHIKKEGAVPRTHGNTGRRPKHAITYDDIKRVVDFLLNVAETYGIPYPSAPRGRDNLPTTYLPSSTTKHSLHTDYTTLCEQTSVRVVKRTSFAEIWRSCVPHIKIASPREDVCATCEKYKKIVQDAVDEDEKIEANASYTKHNVSIPHFSRQTGPTYFASLRKVQIFGVRTDGELWQLNFLVDEDQTIGVDGAQTHGPNAVISMLDHVLDTYAVDEPVISLHADNCPGQNKNRYMLGYLQWRVMTGQQESVEYLMQVPGHGKCHVDNGFGHLKKRYKRSNVETITQLADVVEKSSRTNQAVCYPAWEWRDWKSYLAPLFKPISKFQYFCMRREELGVVTVRTGTGEPEVKLKNAVRNELPTTLPAIIRPAGLSLARQQYLYRVVRPYLSAENQDITCPAPRQ